MFQSLRLLRIGTQQDLSCFSFSNKLITKRCYLSRSQVCFEQNKKEKQQEQKQQEQEEQEEEEAEFLELPPPELKKTAEPIYIPVSEWKRNSRAKDLLLFLKRERSVTKTDLGKFLNLQLRDLRSITSRGRTREIATIIVRPRSIIMHIGTLQAIIQFDRVLFFNYTQDPFAQKIINSFPTRIQKTFAANPFEFRVLESLLIEMADKLENDILSIEPEVSALLDEIVLHQEPPVLQKMHSVQNRLSALQSRVEQLQRCLDEVLNSDEDMAAMYLTEAQQTGKSRQTNSHQEIEMLLENFYHGMAELLARIDRCQKEIKTTEDYIRIHFDSQRNRLIRINLLVSFWTLSVTTSALGASAFGMNLLNHYEQHHFAFPVVCAALGLTGLTTFGLGYLYYTKFTKRRLNLFRSRDFLEQKHNAVGHQLRRKNIN